MAAIDAFHRSFAGSEKWPMACAGFSGGGKGAGYVAPFLARNGCRITGIYLTGVNEDHLSDGYARCQPGADFLRTPIYLSAGHDDRMATPEQQYAVLGLFFAAANLESLESATIKEWCEKWLETKSIETEESTHERHKRIVQRFLECIGTKGNRDLSTLHANDVARFRDREAKERARATANLSLKVLRVCLGEAKRQELIVRNPAESVKLLKSVKESKRRAFTLPEIKRILKACGDNVEWRGLTLFGLYLGQRLGDLAKLTWRAIDLESGEVAFSTRKTGRRIILPLVQPLIEYLSALPASDNPNAYIFPTAAAHKRTNSLSNQFRNIMADAGLVEPRGHEKTKQGRSQAREASELSFHSLRPSAVTMLKAAGASDFIAREIVGHDSAAVSRQYTHLTTDDKRAAMRRLPDVTNG
jgi:integrase